MIRKAQNERTASWRRAHAAGLRGHSRVVRLLILCCIVLGASLSGLSAGSAHAQDGTPSTTLFLPALLSNAAMPQSPAPAPDQSAAGAPAEVMPSEILNWNANMETGDLSQWLLGLPGSVSAESDSGMCVRPSKGVTKDQAHSGLYSMKMTIETTTTTSGCRQFRRFEPRSGEPLYYSAWYYFPKKTYVSGFWNIFQFKSNVGDEDSRTDRGLFWKLNVENNRAGAMVLVLGWKGPIEGPTATDSITSIMYEQALATLPVRQWVHIEVYLKQSETFDGQIIVWQDGVELYNIQNIRTKFPGGEQTWSVNNYGNRLSPSPTPLLIDDVVISPTRVGP